MTEPQVRYLRTVNGGPEIDIEAEEKALRDRTAARKRKRKARKAARKIARRSR